MADNEANKEEALRCVSISRRALEEGDLAKAEKFALKGQKLFNCKEVVAMLVRIHSVKAADDSAPNHTQSQAPHPPGSSHAHANGAQHPASASQHHARAAPAATASGGDPAGMGGSRRQPADSGVRKRHTHGHEKPPIDENAGTPEQRKMVADIVKAKDLYEILALPRTCNDDDIKKAYRKLALKLHPDKNKAAHAEEAFKAVSKAFSCLSDADKRAYYDRTGFENSSAAMAAQQQQQQQRRGAHAGPAGMYYSDDFDPEEIFNMFFGGGLQGQMFRAHFGGGPRRRAQQQQQQQQRQAGTDQTERNPQQAMLAGLMQFLPVILLLFFSLFSMFNTASYSLTRDTQFRDPLHSSRLDVPYFVKSKYEFDRTYPSRSAARVKVEQEVERDYYERLGRRCQQERGNKQQLMYSWSTREEARKMRLPSCEEIDRINEKLGIPVRAY